MNVKFSFCLCCYKFIAVQSTCKDAEKNLVVPVAYTIGENRLSIHIPPALSEEVTTGFMQFRAKHASGSFFAFCPAIR